MATEVYWAARDLDSMLAPIGNHHFILIMAGQGVTLSHPMKCENGKHFITLGGFKKSGRLKFEANNAADVMSVREVIDPGEHVSIWKSDFDMEHHKITPSGMNGRVFAEKCIRLAKNYAMQEKLQPLAYSLFHHNCVAWVNSLFKAACVPNKDRIRASDFWGVDVSETTCLPAFYFKPVMARAGTLA